MRLVDRRSPISAHIHLKNYILSPSFSRAAPICALLIIFTAREIFSKTYNYEHILLLQEYELFSEIKNKYGLDENLDVGSPILEKFIQKEMSELTKKVKDKEREIKGLVESPCISLEKCQFINRWNHIEKLARSKDFSYNSTGFIDYSSLMREVILERAKLFNKELEAELDRKCYYQAKRNLKLSRLSAIMIMQSYGVFTDFPVLLEARQIEELHSMARGAAALPEPIYIYNNFFDHEIAKNIEDLFSDYEKSKDRESALEVLVHSIQNIILKSNMLPIFEKLLEERHNMFKGQPQYRELELCFEKHYTNTSENLLKLIQSHSEVKKGRDLIVRYLLPFEVLYDKKDLEIERLIKNIKEEADKYIALKKKEKFYSECIDKRKEFIKIRRAHRRNIALRTIMNKCALIASLATAYSADKEMTPR